MSNKDTETNELLGTLLDPNSTDSEINKAISSIIKMDREKGLTPKKDRPKNKRLVCHLLATQSEDTTAKELEHYLNHYYKSIEVAKLVVRHPNIDISLFAKLIYFLAEDAKQNPRYDEFQKAENWQSLLQPEPQKAKPYYESFNPSARSFTVDVDRPHIFKVHYWLNNGSPSDKSYIASLNRVDEALLEPFAKDKSPHIRKALAKRKNLSTELASILMKDKARTIRQALAENEHCPEEALTFLTQDTDKTVVNAAIANSSCPADAVHAARLAEKMKPEAEKKSITQLDSDEVIQLLGNASTAPEQLLLLSSLDDNYIKAGVALHRNCPQDSLLSLSQSTNKMVKLSVAFNPETPKDVLKTILKTDDSYFHLALASNPNLSEPEQLELVEKSNDEIRLILADTTESQTVWKALLESAPTNEPTKKTTRKTWRECLEICLDPKGKGLYALQRSRRYRYHFVNKLIARHPKCTESLKAPYAFYSFSSLAKNPQIALQLLENPNAVYPEEYAEWKIKDWLMYDELPGHVVKYYLNHNHVKYSRKGVLCWTAQIVDIQPHVFDDDIHIKKNIASLKNCTQFMFEILARDAKESVRTTVVANRNCPESVLAYLFNDKVASIRISAQSHKKFNAKLVDSSAKPNKVESLKNKGPKRNRIKQAKETTSLTVLRDLAGDKVTEVRLSVIENKKTPKDVLEILKDDESEKIRGLVCSHEKSSIEICKYLFKDAHEEVRTRALSAYINTTSKKRGRDNYKDREYDEATLKSFHSDESESVRAFVASTILDVAIQKKYVQEDSQKVRTSLAWNFNLDKSVALELVPVADRSALNRLAEDTQDKDVFIATLSRDETSKHSISRNDAMCSLLEVQQLLVDHKNPDIRAIAALCTKSTSILNLCVEDIKIVVLEYACYNPALNEDQIEKILERANESMMCHLLESNKGLLKKNLGLYLEHPNAEVRAFLAENLKLNKKLIEKVLTDSTTNVRVGLLYNYKMEFPEDVIESLLNDENAMVKREATWRFKN